MRMVTRKFRILTAAAVFTGSLIAVGFTPSSAVAADRTVSVSGTCLKEIRPDRGAILLSSEVRGEDPKRLAREVGQLYERVKEKVNRLRLEGLELQTTEYLVDEIREWEKEKRVSKGYRARMGLKVSSTEHARLAEVAEVASREGVKEISSLQLYTSPQKMRDERNSCLKEAAEQAKLKAQKLAESLGAKVDEVLTIQESGDSSQPTPHVFREAMMDSRGMKAMAAPTVDAGKEDLSVTVQATFKLK